MRLFSKRKKRDPDEPTFRERYRGFSERLGESKPHSHGTFGQYGGMGMGGPAPPVDPGWERAQREAEEIDRKQALEP